MESQSEPLSGADTAWLRMDSATNLMVINAMLIVDTINFLDFKDVVAKRLLRFDRFNKRPVCYSGLYYWESDPHFDINCHVRQVALTGSADKSALQKFVSEQMSIPLDANKPLWQFQFVENYQGGTAILVRVHHCYADGISLIRVFDTLTDPAANVTELKDFDDESLLRFASGQNTTRNGPAESNRWTAQETLQASTKDDADQGKRAGESADVNNPWGIYQQLIESIWQSIERYSKVGARVSEESLHLVREPLMLKEYAKEILKIINEVTHLASLPSDPLTLLKGPVGVRKSCAWSEPLPIEDLRRAGRLLGCKINDILVSAVAGALGSYLRAQGEKVDSTTIHVTVPVNIRQGEEVVSAENDKLGNNFGTVFLPLPIGIDNPIERVYKVKHDMLGLRNSMQPGISFGLLHALGMMPKTVQKPLLEMFSRKSTAVLSNVPGVRESRYLCGKEISEQMFWVPQTGDIGLGMSLISYGGNVQFGVALDAKLCSEPAELVALCVQEMKRYIQMTDPFQEIQNADRRRRTDQS
jgi:WS/DGAT/MGAT family acyltransferase